MVGDDVVEFTGGGVEAEDGVLVSGRDEDVTCLGVLI